MKIRSGLEAFSVLESGATHTDLKEILELVTPKITKKQNLFHLIVNSLYTPARLPLWW